MSVEVEPVEPDAEDPPARGLVEVAPGRALVLAPEELEGEDTPGSRLGRVVELRDVALGELVTSWPAPGVW